MICLRLGITLLVGCLVIGCTAPQLPQERLSACTATRVSSASLPSELRAVMDACENNPELFARALAKLNGLKPPAGGPKISLQPTRDSVPKTRVRLEIDVFFNSLETYPPDIAFEKLATLIERINTTRTIESIEVTGSSDVNEASFLGLEADNRRASFLRAYLVGAGVPVERISVRTRPPQGTDTVEGRAKNRVAAVVVNLQR
jgi:hypothetical protein